MGLGDFYSKKPAMAEGGILLGKEASERRLGGGLK
jgi:hypothetical protein